MNQKRSDNFDKFSNKKKGSAVKEEYRQEKKKAKVEMRAAGEAMRQRKKIKKEAFLLNHWVIIKEYPLLLKEQLVLM